MMKMVVLVSGGGTNLQAIMAALESGRISETELAAVISNNANAYALERARKENVRDIVVSPADYETREAFNEALLKTINDLHVDLIVLAGYLVTIPEKMIDQYENKIVNVHPSLLPAFCGKGYYGIKVHEAALARGVQITGATVHFVDKGMDTGPIIAQKAIKVFEDDTPKILQQRVMQEAEWMLLPEVIDMIAHNKISVADGKVMIENEDNFAIFYDTQGNPITRIRDRMVNGESEI